MASALINRSIYLGDAKDPQPTFRDEAKDAAAWPGTAVMAVRFEAERFGRIAGLPRTEYFGADGWPLDLPAKRKSELSATMMREFQVFPWKWRHWSEAGWGDARRVPHTFAASRRQGKVVRALAPVTSALCRAP